MEATKRAMKFHKYSMKKAMLGFWGSMLFIFLVICTFYIVLKPSADISLQIGPHIKNGNQMSIIAANMMPISIFFIVYGILTYYEDFGLALSFSLTRKDFYRTVIVRNIVIVLIFSIIQTVLLLIEEKIANALGYNLLVDFGIFNTARDNILFIILLLFILFFTILSISNLIGVLQYRYRYKFWIGFGIASILLIAISSRITIDFFNIYKWLQLIFRDSTIYVTAIIFSCITYIIGYAFLRRAHINN